MTWSQKTKAAGLIFIALFVGSFVVLGNQRQAHADLPDPHDIFCIIDGVFEGTGNPVHPIFGTSCPSGESPTACSDGADNDGDGLVDLADPGCTDGSDNDESNDMCSNILGTQNTVPPGFVLNEGECLPVAVDQCPNLGGIQVTIPSGYHMEGELCVEDVPTPTPGQCEDTIDNDTDGFTDTLDPNCHTDGDATNADSYDGDRSEAGSMPACWDGIDNDHDGKTDWGLSGDENRDPGCTTPTDNDETDQGGGGGGSENTLQLCTDTIDNDSDVLIDLADPDCASFMPKLVVLKVVVNDNSGTSTVSSFPLFISKNFATSSVVSGATTTVAAGTWTVTETSNSAYAATLSGDCNSSGQVTLAAGETKTCVVTNNDVAPGEGGGGSAAQCADGIDNDGDGHTDIHDWGCHTDGNEFNDATYDPNDNDETNATAQTSGGGNGPIAGSTGGVVSGQVLGATTTAAPSSCVALVNSYLRMGRKDNNPEDVKKLQQFLNDRAGANLPITGYFGPLTDAAVRKFQMAHTGEILTPWGIDAPTGFVYKTTQRWINLMHCNTLTIPMPAPLTPFKEN